jgi:signal transduction histidine kinase
MIQERLVGAGFSCEVCPHVEALLSALKQAAGAVLLSQEALNAEQARALLVGLDTQEPWSDIPLLLLTLPLSKRLPQSHPVIGLLAQANVTLLQRPLPQHLFVNAVRSAVRARQRQYQMRDLYQELSRAVQLGDMFVSILGHDLRTPLSAVRMGAELILATSNQDASLRPARRILNSADRMARMTEQLLDFAQIRQGSGLRLRLTSCDFGQIAQQVLQELSDANPQAKMDVSSSGGLAGYWDPDRLGQVVSNLVGNSVQHGAQGSPINVELDGARPEGVRLRVTNRGAISRDAIPTLFEPFKRANGHRSGDRGLGLGLFIARQIVRAHGGELTLDTFDGTTTFEATLPREARPVETDVLSTR